MRSYKPLLIAATVLGLTLAAYAGPQLPDPIVQPAESIGIDLGAGYDTGLGKFLSIGFARHGETYRKSIELIASPSMLPEEPGYETKGIIPVPEEPEAMLGLRGRMTGYSDFMGLYGQGGIYWLDWGAMREFVNIIGTGLEFRIEPLVFGGGVNFILNSSMMPTNEYGYSTTYEAFLRLEF